MAKLKGSENYQNSEKNDRIKWKCFKGLRLHKTSHTARSNNTKELNIISETISSQPSLIVKSYAVVYRSFNQNLIQL